MKILIFKVFAIDFDKFRDKFLREFTHARYSIRLYIVWYGKFYSKRHDAQQIRDNLIFEEIQGGSIGRVFEVNGAYEMDIEAEFKGLCTHVCSRIRIIRTHTRVVNLFFSFLASIPFLYSGVHRSKHACDTTSLYLSGIVHARVNTRDKRAINNIILISI